MKKYPETNHASNLTPPILKCCSILVDFEQQFLTPGFKFRFQISWKYILNNWNELQLFPINDNDITNRLIGENNDYNIHLLMCLIFSRLNLYMYTL